MHAEVDWSGENPGMYLKETAAGPFVTLVSFFRVVNSSRGRGHAAFLILDPDGDGKNSRKPNVCLTDNEPLAKYLCDGFVSKFGAFRTVKSLETLDYKPAWDFMPGGDGSSGHVEWFRSAIGQVQLSWQKLSSPFLVDLEPAASATGSHKMVSLFLDARDVSGTINGNAFEGKPFPREFAGKTDSSTAFLAFSETWVKA